MVVVHDDRDDDQQDDEYVGGYYGEYDDDGNILDPLSPSSHDIIMLLCMMTKMMKKITMKTMVTSAIIRKQRPLSQV